MEEDVEVPGSLTPQIHAVRQYPSFSCSLRDFRLPTASMETDVPRTPETRTAVRRPAVRRMPPVLRDKNKMRVAELLSEEQCPCAFEVASEARLQRYLMGQTSPQDHVSRRARRSRMAMESGSTAAAAAAASATTAATTTAMSESIPSLAAAATQSRDARMASAFGTITHHISPMRPDTDMLCDMDNSLSAPAPVPCMFSTASNIGTQDMYEDDDTDFDDDDEEDDDDDDDDNGGGGGGGATTATNQEGITSAVGHFALESHPRPAVDGMFPQPIASDMAVPEDSMFPPSSVPDSPWPVVPSSPRITGTKRKHEEDPGSTYARRPAPLPPWLLMSNANSPRRPIWTAPGGTVSPSSSPLAFGMGHSQRRTPTPLPSMPPLFSFPPLSRDEPMTRPSSPTLSAWKPLARSPGTGSGPGYGSGAIGLRLGSRVAWDASHLQDHTEGHDMDEGVRMMGLS